jgi:hypothetical protein
MAARACGKPLATAIMVMQAAVFRRLCRQARSHSSEPPLLSLMLAYREQPLVFQRMDIPWVRLSRIAPFVAIIDAGQVEARFRQKYDLR